MREMYFQALENYMITPHPLGFFKQGFSVQPWPRIPRTRGIDGCELPECWELNPTLHKSRQAFNCRAFSLAPRKVFLIKRNL